MLSEFNEKTDVFKFFNKTKYSQNKIIKPLLVHCHIYYPELWPELKEYLNNIFVPYELYVTTIEDNTNLKKEILDFNHKAHFEIIENRGYDIGPFIEIINRINLNQYSYIIKIHTKRNMPLNTIVNNWWCGGAKWRNWALSFLKKENLTVGLKAFQTNKKLGLIGDFHLIFENENGCDEKAELRAKNMLQQANLVLKKYAFVAGSMFMCRASVLYPLQQLKLKITDFDIPDKTHTTGLAHAIERFIGLSVCSEDYSIEDVYTPKIYQKLCIYENNITKNVYMVMRFFFQKKITKSGHIIIKVCKIPVFRYKKV